MNPFLTRGLGLIDLLPTGMRITRTSLATRVVVEQCCVFALSLVVFGLLLGYSALGSYRAAEIALSLALFLSSFRLLFFICYRFWKKDSSFGNAWILPLALVFTCICFLCLMVPGILMVNWTGAYGLRRISTALGSLSMVLTLSMVVSALVAIVLFYFVPDHNKTGYDA